MHVLESQNDFRRVKFHVRLVKNAVLRQMVVQVTAIHQIEDEAELAGRVKCVSHANDEGTVFASRHEAQHGSLVQCQRLALLHLDALLVEAFHCVHFSSVDFSAAVNLAEAATADDAQHAEVVHRQLWKRGSVKR